MADEEPPEDAPRRARRVRAANTSTDPPRSPTRGGGSGTDGQAPRRNGRLGSAGRAARAAATEVAELTGLRPETVISIERCDGGWKVGVEVVETHRIPDSADILATYEVRLEADGELMSYRRTSRYARGQLHREGR